jgi:signal peptidase I
MAEPDAREATTDEPARAPETTTEPTHRHGPTTAESTGAEVAGTKNGGSKERPRRFVGSTPFLILVALGIAILVKTFLVQAFYIPSESMVPTLEVGDRVFVNKLVYDFGDIGRGDVIVFENPHSEQLQDREPIGAFLHWLGEGIGLAQPADEDFIKRVIGLPGETIEIRDDVVYIDDEAIDEPYLTEAARANNGDFPARVVPADSLFVMGDNRGNSADSRFGLGFVPFDKVIGRAFVVIWPPSHLGGLG